LLKNIIYAKIFTEHLIIRFLRVMVFERGAFTTKWLRIVNNALQRLIH